MRVEAPQEFRYTRFREIQTAVGLRKATQKRQETYQKRPEMCNKRPKNDKKRPKNGKKRPKNGKKRPPQSGTSQGYAKKALFPEAGLAKGVFSIFDFRNGLFISLRV
jgi:hypothetical protein